MEKCRPRGCPSLRMNRPYVFMTRPPLCPYTSNLFRIKVFSIKCILFISNDSESLVQITFPKVTGQSLSRMMTHKHFDKDNNNVMSDNCPINREL